MLEKPEIQEEKIAACLRAEYGLDVAQLEFLPLGADQDTAVYKVETSERQLFFLKLRRGEIFEAAIAVPNYLKGIGVQQVIACIPARSGGLFTRIAPFSLILYPYVEGRDGIERNLTASQWLELGRVVKEFHGADFPAALTRAVPRETFSSHWRDTLRQFLARIQLETNSDPAAAELAAFLELKRPEILALLESCERLAVRVKAHDAPFILCHADMHAWNLLVDEDGAFYIVDWDTLIFAPKERDLMFVGSGLMGNGRTLEEETRLFYQGYGQTEVDFDGLAYYRYERIIEDIAVYCEQIFLSNQGGEDRKEALENVKFNFQPGGTIQIARYSESNAGYQGFN